METKVFVLTIHSKFSSKNVFTFVIIVFATTSEIDESSIPMDLRSFKWKGEFEQMSADQKWMNHKKKCFLKYGKRRIFLN